jgi:hypothetical protein
MIRFGFVNYLNTVTPVASSEKAAFPVANIKTPQRPGVPYKSTVATDTSIVMDHGSAKLVEGAFIGHCNFTSIRFQANATDSWGAPTYNQLLTLTRSPNGRYQHFHLPSTAPNLRFNRWFIPTQATTNGASAFSIGGSYIGLMDKPLEDVLFSYDLEVVEPWLEVAPPHGGWKQRSRVGLNAVHLILKRLARVGAAPGIGDDLLNWFELERQFSDADFALVSITALNPAWAWMMRRASGATYTIDTFKADSPLVLEEAL